jgi:hypothetical protein
MLICAILLSVVSNICKGEGDSMASKAKTPKTSFDEVTSRLGQLSQSELVELGDMVAALLGVPGVSRFFAATEEEDDDQVADLDRNGDKPAAKGHVEAKMINGCGPYLYLRYWSGKTLKSKYIGKAKQS